MYLAQQENGLARLKERVEVSEASMHVQADRLANAELQLSETARKLQASVLDKIEEIPRMQYNVQKIRTQIASLIDQLELLKNSKISSESASIHAFNSFGNISTAQHKSHMDLARPTELQAEGHVTKSQEACKSAIASAPYKGMQPPDPSGFPRVLPANAVSGAQSRNLESTQTCKKISLLHEKLLI